jgi:ABC-type multidrug transport system fused ATPase/permease subunit
MSFFHTNPLGRIINRCTKDVSEMDKNVADNINMFARSFLTLISTVVLMGSVSPILLPFIVVIMVMFYFIYLYFQCSVRECKRLESVSYSPLYTSLTDAITGLSSIRAYRQQQRLIASNSSLVDCTSRFALAQQSFNRWLSVRQVSKPPVLVA